MVVLLVEMAFARELQVLVVSDFEVLVFADNVLILGTVVTTGDTQFDERSVVLQQFVEVLRELQLIAQSVDLKPQSEQVVHRV